MKEIETRTLVPSNQVKTVINTLKELGFKQIDEFKQTDIIFDRKDAALFKSGQKIRLRIEKGIAELTYKGLFEGDSSMSRRIEINLPVLNEKIEDTTIFLSSIGYPKLFTIIKNRILFKKNGIEASLDEWPILGHILEFEGNEDEIKILIKSFKNEFKFGNTRLKQLFKDKINETGKSFQELKDEYELSTGNSLGKIELIIK